MNQRIGGKIFHQYILHKVPKKKIMLSSQNSGKYPDIDKVWTLEENPETGCDLGQDIRAKTI